MGVVLPFDCGVFYIHKVHNLSLIWVSANTKYMKEEFRSVVFPCTNQIELQNTTTVLSSNGSFAWNRRLDLNISRARMCRPTEVRFKTCENT